MTFFFMITAQHKLCAEGMDLNIAQAAYDRGSCHHTQRRKAERCSSEVRSETNWLTQATLTELEVLATAGWPEK